MIFIFLFIASIANGFMDLVSMKPSKPLGGNNFTKWLYGNKVYFKGWMYPFLMPLSDGWHFFKGVMIVFMILAVTTNFIQVFVLFYIWMIGHEFIFLQKGSSK